MILLALALDSLELIDVFGRNLDLFGRQRVQEVLVEAQSIGLKNVE
jgi:hypothetical protein